MSSFTFDYSIFFKFYTDVNNVFIDNSPKPPLYFFRTEPPARNNPQYLEPSIWPNRFIIVNNIQIYIDIHRTNDLLFIIPSMTTFNDKVIYLSDHYHFGTADAIDNYDTSRLKADPPIVKNSIYFHKSVQNIQRRGKIPNACWFLNKSNITDVENLICTNISYSTSKTMKQKFQNEIDIIKDIIQRPFIKIGSSSAKAKSYRLSYKKTAKKYTDYKGNKYVIYNKGEKQYIKKLSKSTGKFTYREIKT